MAPGGQTQARIETADIGKKEKKDSNLSPTALLVNGMLKGLENEGKKFVGIMPALRLSGLVGQANEIIKLRLKPDNSQVIEFCLACRKKQAELQLEAQAANCDERQNAVIPNFFAKMIGSVKTSASYGEPAPEAPTQTA